MLKLFGLLSGFAILAASNAGSSGSVALCCGWFLFYIMQDLVF
nr:hypothetical protein [uncultured Tolumonas sp.]